jgi:hypothetical protein
MCFADASIFTAPRQFAVYGQRWTMVQSQARGATNLTIEMPVLANSGTGELTPPSGGIEFKPARGA